MAGTSCRFLLAFHRILLLLPLLLLVVIPCPAQGQQQSMTDFVYGGCNVNAMESNSTFAHNLNDTVLTDLMEKAATGERYYFTSVTNSADNSASVYGAYQCRGDLSAENCSTCIVRAITEFSCSNGLAIGMRVQLAGCYYRYENYDFSTSALIYYDVWSSNCSTEQNTSLLYQAEVTATLESTVALAPFSDNYYYSIHIGSAYALAQCFGYISPSNCSTCLSQSFNRSSICNTSSSGFFYYASCFYLFSDTTFVISLDNSSISNSSVIAAPSLPPAISPSPASSANANTGGYTPNAGYSSSNLSARAIAGICIGAASAAAMIAVASFCVARTVNRRRYVEALRLMGGGQRPFIKISSSSEFSIKELQSATERFHSRNKLGQGGFGVVYKGTLKDGIEVAIKIISPGRQDQVDFMNEAKLITTVQHRNLIQLLGYAMDDFRWYLVYEYLPNRSLDLHLFAGESMHGTDEFEAISLDWRMRFNIINGIARGLCYLHEESHVRIVHRDIKAGNILLDGNLDPKIADFGLARLFANDVSHLTTAVAGTLGYVAPEYAMGGQLSEKVDVYSFGLVALEIVSGRRAIQTNIEDAEHSHILQWAWALYERKQLLEMVDERILLMEGSVAEEIEGEVARVVQVALMCTQMKPQERPAMSQVCRMLQQNSQSAACTAEDLDLQPPSRPGIVSMGIFSAGIFSTSDSYQFSEHQDSTPITLSELHPD